MCETAGNDTHTYTMLRRVQGWKVSLTMSEEERGLQGIVRRVGSKKIYRREG